MVRVIVLKNISLWCEQKFNLIFKEDENLLDCEVIKEINNIKSMRESYKKEKLKRKRILADYRCLVRKKMCK